MRCALLVLLLAVLAAGSHFRGVTISWSSDKDTPGLVNFAFRIAWRLTSSDNECTQQRITDGVLHGSTYSVDYWSTDEDGDLSTTQYYCTDFSVDENWATGGNTFSYTFNDNSIREVHYGPVCCWGTVNLHGSGDWYARTLVDLSPRSDTGQPNSSPITASAPVVKITQECDAVIRFPVEDPDGDAVRCRWGIGADECGDVCGGPPGVTLDEETCTLYYDATIGLATGWWAIALVLEDFSRSPSCSSPPFPPECGPFTQIPLQLLALVESSSVPCDQRPGFVRYRAPSDQTCFGIPISDTFSTLIEGEATGSGVTVADILTTSPIGLTKSSLTVDPNNPQRASVTVTWTPTAQQAGPNVFCFRASDSLRYIGFFDDTDTEVYTIDTSDVQLSGNTLSFTTPPNLFSIGDHHILMDAGFVVKPAAGCAAGSSFVGISDRSAWTFTASCPEGYAVEYGFGRCIHVHKRPLTYLDAREYCQNRDGRIFQLDNEEDVNRTKTLLDLASANKNTHFGMWVGLTDETTEGTFAWEDGTPLASGDFSDWAPQPYDHNSNKRDCVQMKQKFDWLWVVRSCRRTRNFFICEPN
ncbi:MRC1 [Branchiostoma lanceolatum]|uniref:MRC1 protein n=1 Tax=Branchiostoma lanceolatum TaxID=7740 RepID=A0A8K0A9M2_BRALA|nr:MRC1 [Branchiostoma lanceolatum]